MHYKRKKARKSVAAHRCWMCTLSAPKRFNRKDRWPARDRKRMEEKE